jgi:hypothetical protein
MIWRRGFGYLCEISAVDSGIAAALPTQGDQCARKISVQKILSPVLDLLRSLLVSSGTL